MTRRMNWEDARDVLRKLREDQIRDGQRVIDIWKEILENYANRLGDEVWTVQEQVTVAALDCQNTELAEQCIMSLELKFPNSMRVKRLRGMYHEAHGRYNEAERVYKEILQEDETNMFARKRQIAILKEKNEIVDAIKKLNEYLESFMTDFDAWMELCDLYLTQQDYTKASFCMEELIMSNPHNHLFHQKFAEIKYTEGGSANLEIARSYFAQACKLNPNNTRAQFGLLLKFVWVKNLQGVPKEIMWPCRLLNINRKEATIYIKSDHAELTVKNGNVSTLKVEEIEDNKLKFQSILQDKKKLATLTQFKSDIAWIKAEFQDDSKKQRVNKSSRMTETDSDTDIDSQIISADTNARMLESDIDSDKEGSLVPDKTSTSSNLSTGHSKSTNRQVNTKCAAWAAAQIKEKYQISQSPEQLKSTKVLDAIEKVLESLSASTST